MLNVKVARAALRSLSSTILLPAFCAAYAAAAPAAPAADAAVPLTLEVYGDSITAGVWADSSIGTPGPRFLAEIALLPLTKIVLDRIGRGVNDIEDLDERARYYDGLFRHIKRPALSAFIGNEPYSLPVRLAAATGRPVRLVGSPMLAGNYRDAMVQVQRVVAAYQREPSLAAAEMVVVNFNGMDFVFDVAPADHAANVRRFFLALTQRNPAATFVVTELLDTVSLVSEADQEAFQLLGRHVNCSEMYDGATFGKAQGVAPGTTGPAIDAAQAYREALNTAVREELELVAAGSGGYEHVTGKVVRVGNVQPQTGSWRTTVAADCIHPNREGQRQLGEAVWSALEAAGL